MGIVREPEGIDFVIKSTPMTEAEEKELSLYIKKRKAEIAKQQAQMKTAGKKVKT